MTDLQHLFELGGPAMWAITSLAVLGVTIFIERMVVVLSMVGQLQALDRRLRDAVLAGNLPELVATCAKAPGGIAPVLMRGLEAAMRKAGRDDIFAEMTRDGRRLSLKMRRGLGMLATLGSMSPFMGLFGTVLGIMSALKNIGASGSGGLDVVAGGVSEALVTTAAGILVAIVMVLLHQFLRAQLSRGVLEVQVLVEDAADYFGRLPPGALGNDPTSLLRRKDDMPPARPVLGDMPAGVTARVEESHGAA